MALSKHIPIIFEISYERLADHRAGEGTNPSCSIKVGVVEMYLFKPFNGLHHRSVLFYVHGLEMIVHLHHSCIAFVCNHLIFAQLSCSIVGREFDH